MKKKLGELELGERCRLLDTDNCPAEGDYIVAELREGGRSGGCEHDLYVAYICDAEGEDDEDDLPLVVTDQAESEELEISL